MKGAVASVEIFAQRGEEPIQRLSFVVGTPTRTTSKDTANPDPGWTCRVALANLHRPVVIEGPDSIAALERALALGRDWLAALRDEGFELYRDRQKERRYPLDPLPGGWDGGDGIESGR